MKIAIIGYGKVGKLLADMLEAEDQIEKIYCFDIRPSEENKNKKVVYENIDAGNSSSLKQALEKDDIGLVINASLPVFNLYIMEICLTFGMDYLDLASYWDFDQDESASSPYKVEQLDYDKKFREKGLLGLINAGVSPGLTNLMAKECSRQLDEVDSIKIRLYEDSGTEEFYFSWSKEWTLDEICWKPLVYENGKFKIEENFSGNEEFEFPENFGKRKVALISQEEVGTIPLYIKAKNVDFKSYDNHLQTAKMIWRLGLASEKKIKIVHDEISPLEFLMKILPETDKEKIDTLNAVFAFTVIAEGIKGEKPKTEQYSLVFPRHREINKIFPGGNHISYPTALMIKSCILAMPLIKDKGVFPPECLDEKARNFILCKLKDHDIEIIKKAFTPRAGTK
jgi:saccharopine dehydrogenase (NAD+, L-lysine forming)